MSERCDIPDTLLSKLYDETGQKKSNQGFYLYFINKRGNPNCVARPVDSATKLGLLTYIQNYEYNQMATQSKNLPQSLLIALNQYTGNKFGKNKGYFLFYVNKDGEPDCRFSFSDSITSMTLSRALEDEEILGLND